MAETETACLHVRTSTSLRLTMNDSRLVIKLTQDVVVSLSFACGIETVLRIHGKGRKKLYYCELASLLQ